MNIRMKIELDHGRQDINRITSYTDDCLYINEKRISRSCIITAREIIQDWSPVSVTDIRPAHFDPVLALQPEIILLGTGSELIIPDMEVCAHIQGRNIGFEFMDSGAAIRSYNILISEDRNVALALLVS
ncbi:MAG: Mth938-like domain-containing protein [Thiotrichales bacterium]|nr:Mth938-like domain-containing protein [Thiotrichales bacterium]